MLIDKIARINKVGFTVLLTIAAVWLVSLPLIPGANDAAESPHHLTHEELVQAAQLEYPPAVQAEF